MLPAQRLQYILQDLTEYGSGTIAELSEKYGVSEMTIRRDLKQLEDQGYIRRTFGGAVTTNGLEPRYSAKQSVQAEAKQQIARYAAEHFVTDNDVIILEGGTTVTMMAAYLSAYHNLTIVTNGLFTLYELRTLLPKHTVISTGGMLRDVSFTLVGPTTEAFFGQFHANRVFLSATGWDARAGFSDPNMLETSVKRAMLRSAETSVMLLDSSKLGTKSLSTFVDADTPVTVVTDSHARDEHLALLRASGLDVRIAFRNGAELNES